ncbi:MAG: glycosyltransferase family 2 protein [Candidatus Kerfeldbacteria bacterium]|nr:glycosyltransferase family 2 protein [Candidatus Kerfeldbacteria bacterium]
MSTPRLSILILSWNAPRHITACLDSLMAATATGDVEIIVIDNASSNQLAHTLRQRYPAIRLVCNQTNVGYALGNNQAYQLARGHYSMLLNQDTVVTPATVQQLISFLDSHPGYAAVTPVLRNPDGSLQYYMHRRWPTVTGLLLALLHKRWPRFQPKLVQRYLYLDQTWQQDFDIEQAAGACLMLRRSAIVELGDLFDVRHFPLYYNDVDLCYRLAQHHQTIRCLTTASIVHDKGTSVRTLPGTFNALEYAYASLWFFKKHGQWFDFWLLRLAYITLFTILVLFRPAYYKAWLTAVTLKYYGIFPVK